mgnify:CR=1 FL=1
MLNHRTTRTRTLGLALLAALSLAAALAILPGCESTPAEPEYDNPFDPNGPNGGDALQVTAKVTILGISVGWTQPQDMGITYYRISHRDDPDGAWEEIGEKDHTTAEFNSITYEDPAPTKTHYFQVQARDDLGNFSLTGYATPGSVDVGPWVQVASGSRNIATRYPEVRFWVTAGESLRAALDTLFTDGLVELAAGTPDDTDSIVYDLGLRVDGDQFSLYSLAYTGIDVSNTTVTPLTVKFEPAFVVVDTPATVATLLVDLLVPTEGVLQMKFANSEADLAAAPWMPPAGLVEDFPLLDSANPQKIWGQFDGDFGFISEAIDLDVTPDPLTDVQFVIDLTDGTTSVTTVPIISRAVATEMRISESPDFSAVPWVDYADTTTYQITPEPGTKILHAQYRNDFVQSSFRVDTLYYIPEPAEIAILDPVEGQVIRGGATYLVQGSSAGLMGQGSVDTVQFDPGEGGYRDVVGLDDWTYEWSVPAYLSDTNVTLRARAVLDGSEVVTTTSVTVTQLAIRIDAPLDGAQLSGDTEVEITGRAVSVIDGAAIDSVTVDITGLTEDYHLKASGTSEWTTTWTTPTMTAIMDAVLTARVYAGGEVAGDEINVTVAPQK